MKTCYNTPFSLLHGRARNRLLANTLAHIVGCNDDEATEPRETLHLMFEATYITGRLSLVNRALQEVKLVRNSYHYGTIVYTLLTICARR